VQQRARALRRLVHDPVARSGGGSPGRPDDRRHGQRRPPLRPHPSPSPIGSFTSSPTRQSFSLSWMTRRAGSLRLEPSCAALVCRRACARRRRAGTGTAAACPQEHGGGREPFGFPAAARRDGKAADEPERGEQGAGCMIRATVRHVRGTLGLSAPHMAGDRDPSFRDGNHRAQSEEEAHLVAARRKGLSYCLLQEELSEPPGGDDHACGAEHG
jgi:hypothetical protein